MLNYRRWAENLRENGIPITLQRWGITDLGANPVAAQRQLDQIPTVVV